MSGAMGPATAAEQLARISLSLGAIRLRPDQPFRWASGYLMPIYNDNRALLSSPDARALIADAFSAMIGALGEPADAIAGTATAGIPHATTLADRLRLPLVYVRSGAKDHGLTRRVEGLAADGDLNGRHAVLIEDLVSTGGSSIDALLALRETGARVTHCMAIFQYGFARAREAFAAVNPHVELQTILDLDLLIRVAVADGHLHGDQVALIEEWRTNPFGWGEAHFGSTP